MGHWKAHGDKQLFNSYLKKCRPAQNSL